MKRFLLAVAFLALFSPFAHAQAGLNASYSAAITGLVPASAATDIFTITGSASKTVYISKVIVTCTETTAATIDVQLLTRSSADTSGTSTAPTLVAHDPNNQGSASSTVKAYTVNPTTGSLVGVIGSYKMDCPTAAAGASQDLVLETFGISADMLVLRGINQVFAVNLNGQTVAGGSINVRLEFREN